MTNEPTPAKVRLNDELGPNAPADPWQGGMTNDQLSEAWRKKLPNMAPTDNDLAAFALGVEVGFAHARDLERQDWSRVHHALAKHKAHPGRTDDHLADVIDRELEQLRAALDGLLRIHTEPAGFRGKYGKELSRLLDEQQVTIDAKVSAAKAALGFGA